MAYRNYSVGVSHIVDPSGLGDFTTITTAMAAASSGQTLILRPGTYTENFTITPGVNVTAFNCDATTPNVIVNGTITMTGAGSCSISGVQLKTNSAYSLAVTGSANSIIWLNNCYIYVLNNTAINYSSSGASSGIKLFNCVGEIGTTGITYFTATGSGSIIINNCELVNDGGSTTASTTSSCSVYIYNSNVNIPLSSTSTGNFQIYNAQIFNGANNATSLTTAGTATSYAWNSILTSGTASAISIGTGTTLSASQLTISSSNTNAITGAGTLTYQGLCFTGSSKTINTTTQSQAGTLFGSTTTAPTAGMIGEQIRATVASGAAVTLNNTVLTNITSISVTAGVWSITGIVQVNANANSYNNINASVNTTSATLGTLGDNNVQGSIPNSNTDGLCVVPAWVQVFTTTTTVYLVSSVSTVAGGGSGKGYGRISAIRIA